MYAKGFYCRNIVSIVLLLNLGILCRFSRIDVGLVVTSIFKQHSTDILTVLLCWIEI